MRSHAEASLRKHWHQNNMPRRKNRTNNKGTDQPVHLHNLISTFVIRFLKSQITRSDVYFNSQFCWDTGLQDDIVSGYTPAYCRYVLKPHATQDLGLRDIALRYSISTCAIREKHSLHARGVARGFITLKPTKTEELIDICCRDEYDDESSPCNATTCNTRRAHNCVLWISIVLNIIICLTYNVFSDVNRWPTFKYMCRVFKGETKQSRLKSFKSGV